MEHETDDLGRDQHIKLYRNWWWRMRKLSDAQKVEVLVAVGEYAWDGTEREFEDPAEQMAYEFMREAARRDWLQASRNRDRRGIKPRTNVKGDTPYKKRVSKDTLSSSKREIDGGSGPAAAGPAADGGYRVMGLVPGGTPMVGDD